MQITRHMQDERNVILQNWKPQVESTNDADEAASLLEQEEVINNEQQGSEQDKAQNNENDRESLEIRFRF